MSRQARVGLLVLAGVCLFMVALFAVANRSFLFSDTFFVRSRFNNVAGLQPGAEVQFQGVTVGRVETVSLPLEAGGQIVVTMAINEKARHLIHQSTQAQIKSDGLVGTQMVVLVNPAEVVGEPIEEGDFIPGAEPFDFFEVTDRAMASVQRFEKAATAFEQIMIDVQHGEGTLGKIIYDPALYNSFVQTADETQRLMHSMGNNAEALVTLAGRATEGVNSILEKIDQGEGTLAKMINDPSVYNSLVAASDTLVAISGDLRAVTSSAENAANWAALGMYRLSENMEALKHNWLFRRYYEERGYAEKAPFETREHAIEQSFRALEAKERELLEWEQRLKEREQTIEALVPDSMEQEVRPASVTAQADQEEPRP